MRIALISVCLLASFPYQAHGTATYDAKSSGSIRVTGISPRPETGLVIGYMLGDQPPLLPEFGDFIISQLGDSTAVTGGLSILDAVDPIDMVVGEGLVQEATASGTAQRPSGSLSSAGAVPTGTYWIDNGSDETVTVDFLIEYSMTATAVVDDAAHEFADASVDVSLSGTSSNHGPPIEPFYDFLFIDTTTEGGTLTEGGTHAFSVTYEPGEFNSIGFSVSAFGEALATHCGDFDFDGDVDSADRTTQTQNWTGAAMAGQFDLSFEEGDCDNDGDVDTADQTGVIQNWTGAQMVATDTTDIHGIGFLSAPTTTENVSISNFDSTTGGTVRSMAVPEPESLTSIAMVLCCLIGTRRLTRVAGNSTEVIRSAV